MRLAIAYAPIIALLTATSAWANEPCWPATADNPLEDELVVLTSGGSWTTATVKALWDPFEAACGVKVVQFTLPNNTFDQVHTLITSGDVPFDFLGSFNAQRYQQLRDAGLLEKLPDDVWNGFEDILLPDTYSEFGVWSTPYTTTMIYNTEVFPNGINSWEEFWDTETYPGPRTLQDSATNVVLALLSTGMANDAIYPITDEKLDLAYEQLNKIRPSIRNFWTTGDAPVQGVGSGEFVAGTAWNGRTSTGMKNGLPIEMSWDGNLMTSSWWVVPINAKHPRAAAAAMRFLQDAQRQTELANIIGYAGPVKGVETFMNPEAYKVLATNPDNASQASILNPSWWSENEARMSEIWSRWTATGVYKR